MTNLHCSAITLPISISYQYINNIDVLILPPTLFISNTRTIMSHRCVFYRLGHIPKTYIYNNNHNNINNKICTTKSTHNIWGEGGLFGFLFVQQKKQRKRERYVEERDDGARSCRVNVFIVIVIFCCYLAFCFCHCCCSYCFYRLFSHWCWCRRHLLLLSSASLRSPWYCIVAFVLGLQCPLG